MFAYANRAQNEENQIVTQLYLLISFSTCNRVIINHGMKVNKIGWMKYFR